MGLTSAMKSVGSMSNQRGAVSIFVVIFAALLITIVTVSFVRIMVNDQNQATNSDLSQSAYDSALAGVEDAKRALLRYQSICQTGTQVECDEAGSRISSNTCNAVVRYGDVIGSDSEGEATTGVGEIRIQQSTTANDEALEQAYTCVTVDLETPDYVSSSSSNISRLIPLRATEEFNTVTIEWFSRDDLGTSTTSTSVNLLSGISSPMPLRQTSSWPVDRPPLLRTQLMQYGDSFTLEQFDYMSGSESNANTIFLYPTSASAANTSTSFAARDQRRTSPTGQTPADISADTPLPVRCRASLASGGYSCQIDLTLPAPIGGGDRTAYLRLTPLYNTTHFRVSLANGSRDVDFDGVQPIVDSTGRANDLFRRVQSRVDMEDTTFPYPEGAIDLSSGDLCKNFAVTDTSYIGRSGCTP